MEVTTKSVRNFGDMAGEVTPVARVSTNHVTRSVKAIQDLLRKDPGVDGDAQRVSQLGWMIFLKALDQQESAPDARSSTSQSSLPDELRWRSWTNRCLKMTDLEVISFVNEVLLPRMKNLPSKVGDDPFNRLVSSIFDGTRNTVSSGSLFRDLIRMVDALPVFDTTSDRHVLGDVYEQFLGDLQNAGNAGEFYTPRPITQFMAEMIAPQVGETVFDPACGTGGFLVSALDFIRRDRTGTRLNPTWMNSIRGVEKKSLPHLLCVTNLMLHGVRVPSSIVRGNALSNDACGDQVDVILTNPPFGGEEEDSIQRGFPSWLQSKETVDLFLGMILERLSSNGRCAIILPDGFLFGGGVKTRIKIRLLRECNLHTIVRLPNGVFSPYTGISTNILFFQKGTPTKDIWYFQHPYPKGIKTYSKTRPIVSAEFDVERDWWKNREEGPNSWRVNIEQIEACDHNLDQRNPYRVASRVTSSTNATSMYARMKSSQDAVWSEIRERLVVDLGSREPVITDFLNQQEAFLSIENGPALLSKLILKLAFQGRLMAPNPLAETLDGLMTHLCEVRGSLDLGANKHKEPWFEIPSAWRWVRLGDLGTIVGGGTPKTDRPENFTTGGQPWLTPADLYRLKGKYIGAGKRDLSEVGLRSCGARVLPKGTVLFSSRAPIGYVAIASNEIATNQGFKSCVPFLSEMTDFLYYYLRYAGEEIDRRASGTTFKEVSGQEMKQIPVPLPPMSEQVRIVAELEAMLDLCNRLDACMALTRGAARELLNAAIHSGG